MENKQLLIAMGVIVIVGLIVIALTYILPGRTNIPQNNQDDRTERFMPDRITAKHWFIDGEHTVAGEVEMPTPCDLLEATTTASRIDFTTINNSEFCAQVMTPARFKVSFTASQDAPITATWNGEPIELNLVPAEPDEDPDDFELFIKG